MKWSKQGKLSIYGVALVGWPREVEYKNPSRMSSSETSKILSLLRQGTLRFTSLQNQARILSREDAVEMARSDARLSSSESTTRRTKGNEADTDISWAYNEADADIDLEASDNGGLG